MEGVVPRPKDIGAARANFMLGLYVLGMLGHSAQHHQSRAGQAGGQRKPSTGLTWEVERMLQVR